MNTLQFGKFISGTHQKQLIAIPHQSITQTTTNYMKYTPETNIAPENGWLEYYFPFGMAYFQGSRFYSKYSLIFLSYQHHLYRIRNRSVQQHLETLRISCGWPLWMESSWLDGNAICPRFWRKVRQKNPGV